jgi:hypothetical protein
MSTVRWTVLAALALAPAAYSAATEELRTYSNAEHHYRFTYPAKWHISVVPGKGGPTLYNYDLSSAPGHGLLPQHGAEIFVLPHSDLSRIEPSRTPQEWAAEDVRRFSQGGLTKDEFENASNPNISHVLRVAYDSQTAGDDEAQRYVAFYFQLSGEILKAQLVYWKNDPKGASYESTLLSVVRSIRRISA